MLSRVESQVNSAVAKKRKQQSYRVKREIFLDCLHICTTGNKSMIGFFKKRLVPDIFLTRPYMLQSTALYSKLKSLFWSIHQWFLLLKVISWVFLPDLALALSFIDGMTRIPFFYSISLFLVLFLPPKYEARLSARSLIETQVSSSIC